MTATDGHNSWLNRFVLTITQNPKTVLALCLLLIFTLGAQLKDLEINSTTYVLNKSHPIRVIDSELSEIFTSTGATLSVMVAPKSGSVFDSAALKLVSELTQKFEAINLVRDSDVEKLNTFARDEASSTLVAQALENGLSPSDTQAIEDLRSHLLSTSQLGGKDETFLNDLLIFIDPIIQVRSITNIEDIRNEDDVLIIDELLANRSLDPESLKALSKHVMDNPLLMRSVVSEDLDATVIRVELAVPNDYTSPVIRTYDLINEMTQNISDDYTIAVGGSAVVFNEMSHIIKQDNKRFFPFILLVIMITLALCFRNIEGIYVPILIAVASLVCTMGVMPLAGLKQNMISSLTPIFVMASAVADAIHVLNHYYRSLSQDGLSKQQAIQAAVTKLFKPILLTSVTTICGFLSLAYTEVIFIREFGIMVAVGIFFAFIFSIVMIPALLMLNKRSRPSHKKSLLLRGIQVCLNSCNTAWQNSPKVIVGIMSVLFMVSAFYAINVKVDYETISFYPEESKLRVDDRAFKDKLDGIIPLTIKFTGKEEEALFRKDVVDYIDQVETVLNQHSDVGYLVSSNSYLRRMLQVLSDGDRDKLPDDLSEDMMAQLFLLYD
ncbi:MAG: MMPL family transporter, partial [Arenicella sp.]|nr:MMPL family transporter [Arenicella sp.]